MKTNVEKLDSAIQREWLRQHIPHRICAALTWLEMKGEWKMPPHPEWGNKEKDKFHIWCIGRSVDEGRKASMRWLIEFVGIKDEKKRPARPSRRKQSDIWIEHFEHGKEFKLVDVNAQKLADMWRGCSKSSAHSTVGTAHPPVGEQELAEALRIVIAHLEKHLYIPNGYSLLKIVRDQEALLQSPQF